MSIEFSGNTQKPWKAATTSETILEYIHAAINNLGGAVAPPGGLATEITLQAVLTVLTDLFSEQRIDFELKCVEDGNGDIYLLRVTWDENAPGGYTIDYIDAAGNVVVPVAPLKICSPNEVLQNILTEIQKLTAEKAPVSLTQNTDHVVPVGATEITVFNNGATNITINGAVTPPGFKRSYGFKNPISAVLNVVTSGNQVLIDYMT
jgi:hypothetical protein